MILWSVRALKLFCECVRVYIIECISASTWGKYTQMMSVDIPRCVECSSIVVVLNIDAY